MARLLIKFGIDLNKKDVAGHQALYYAVIQGFHRMTILLIANFASCFCQKGVKLAQLTDDTLMKVILEKGKLY